MTIEQFDDRAMGALRELTGDPAARFRDGQLEAIRAVVGEKRRVLVVQRTGWGKSAVYFVATRLLREQGAGPTLLVSPLLALMRNQVEAAARGGVRAESMNSTNTDDWDGILERLEEDRIDLLLISEQRLRNDRFRDAYLPVIARRSGLVVVDEVHCISDWGHDFRPWYRRIARFIELLPGTVPVLGCTATANDRVLADVEHQLGNGLLTVRGPLDRSGLSLQVIDLPSQTDRLAWLAQHVPKLDGTGIVYCLTVRDTRRVADFLRSEGIDAESYSGAEEAPRREEVEAALLANQLKVVVATSALGMGFDKPDLAFVIHFQMPGSPVAYYQQVGRAGRQLERSWGFGLVGTEDTDIQDGFISTAFPPPDAANAVVALLASAEAEGMTPSQIEARVNVKHGRLEAMLAQLEVDGVVERRSGRWHRTLAAWTYPRERVKTVTAIRRAEQDDMRRYTTSTQCRAEVLRTALDDDRAAPCGICDNCGNRAGREPLDHELRSAASRYLRHQYVPVAPRRQWPSGLDEPRGRIAAGELLETGWALCTWGDPIWGKLVNMTDAGLVALLLTNRITPVDAKPFGAWALWRLEENLGSLGPLLGASVESLITERLLPPAEAERIAVLLDAVTAFTAARERLEATGVHMLSAFDELYPQVLRPRMPWAAPPVLYAAGLVEWLNTPAVAVVGSRDVTEEGAAVTRSIAEAVVDAGATLVSGAARGVDRLAMGVAIGRGARWWGSPAKACGWRPGSRTCVGLFSIDGCALPAPMRPIVDSPPALRWGGTRSSTACLHSPSWSRPSTCEAGRGRARRRHWIEAMAASRCGADTGRDQATRSCRNWVPPRFGIPPTWCRCWPMKQFLRRPLDRDSSQSTSVASRCRRTTLGCRAVRCDRPDPAVGDWGEAWAVGCGDG